MLFAIDKMKCVCVCNLLINSVSLFISFKTLSNVDALSFNQLLVVFVPGMCYIQICHVLCKKMY